MLTLIVRSVRLELTRPQRSPGPQPGASANSATSANLGDYSIALFSVNITYLERIEK